MISKSKSDYTWEHSLNVSRGLSPLENDPNSVTNIACSASNIYFTVPYQDKYRCKCRIYPTRGSGDDLINIFINYTYYGTALFSYRVIFPRFDCSTSVSRWNSWKTSMESCFFTIREKFLQFQKIVVIRVYNARKIQSFFFLRGIFLKNEHRINLAHRK